MILGDLWQLPPVYDNLLAKSNKQCSLSEPNHWKENFKIYYLTEKMRSMNDPEFSNLCDRVGRGKLSKEDEAFLQSRVQDTDLELDNENYKTGKLSIIVTTNKKKEIVNKEKLDTLLPYEKEYVCNSIDRVTNLPGRRFPKQFETNSSKTGNLLTELNLKVGAPVMITSNHQKKKYKEDGIMNGARGYVQAIQVSKEDSNRVEVIWVVFNKENTGRLYRFEHRHLLKNFNPGHKLATPILPQRKSFKARFGNVEYLRTNFPLSLAYAMTAHKCQGETLEFVIIDFGSDLESNVKNFICAGSFYVALTRVREGNKVFLKSFETSYIIADNEIEEKVEAMLKFRSYKFKKTYLDEQIFVKENSEIKAGYLNINGLFDANHGHYLNEDHNLRSLDILIAAEPKLNKSFSNTDIQRMLFNWYILDRFDSNDENKHMGLIALASKNSILSGKFNNFKHIHVKRNECLQIQGMILSFKNDINFGFLYSRSTPNKNEINYIQKAFNDCDVIMGDLNLSHKKKEDQQKLDILCGNKKKSILNELTRSISNNQLDYVMANEEISGRIYSTSYKNFISDHNSITVRIGFVGNRFSNEMLERFNFDYDFHLKTKRRKVDESHSCSSLDEVNVSVDSMDTNEPKRTFNRKFKNLNMTSCWLNSCLQLILNAMEYFHPNCSFDTELGLELVRLLMSDTNSLDCTGVKNIIVKSEDTRIKRRISELKSEINDPHLLRKRIQQVEDLRLDLISGQQCVRDFFICLQENAANWFDVHSFLNFGITQSFICCTCYNSVDRNDSIQLYVELDIPCDNSNLNIMVEKYFSSSPLTNGYCDAQCFQEVDMKRIKKITSIDEAQMITIMLTRSKGYQVNRDRVIATDDVFIQ